jgi:hypothetical protein
MIQSGLQLHPIQLSFNVRRAAFLSASVDKSLCGPAGSTRALNLMAVREKIGV